MSFSLSMDNGKLEWASHDLSTIFIQRRNIFSPSFLRMVYDVIRFGKEAPQVCCTWCYCCVFFWGCSWVAVMSFRTPNSIDTNNTNMLQRP